MNTTKPNSGSELNFSDVIDVIERDPDYGASPPGQTDKDLNSDKSTGKATIKAESSTMISAAATADNTNDAKHRAQVKILEQPASKALRFRYECEGRLAGSLPGANSTSENKTYPTIQVVGYRGKAVVVVSCVTKDFPYKPHPHSLVGKEGCKKGVCTLEINNENMICSFSNLGVQCVKKKGIEEALKLREEIRVDPFHTGFAHKNQPQNIDLNAVRLCFQVFLEGAQKGKFTLALKPVVSEPIYDKKAMCELTICKLSDCSSPVNGGKEIILLCDKVTKDDIQVLFYQEEDGRPVWEANGDFSASDVHKQVAISFRTPRYRVTDIEEPVSVFIQLRRPSDGACSEARRFEYLPLHSDAEMLKRKRQRLFESNANRLKDFILDNVLETPDLGNIRGFSPNITVEALRQEMGGAIPRPIKQVTRTTVKREPIDTVSADTPAEAGFNFEPNFNAQFTLNIPNLAFGASNPSPTASPNPPYHNYEYRFPTSPHYNIPVHSPNHGVEDYMNQMRTVNITDLDSLNLQYPSQQPLQSQQPQQQPNELNDFRAINLPLSDCNIQLIDSHLLSNLSLHDDDSNDRKESDRNESMSTSNIPPELPVLTFSGMLTSSDLDGPDGFGRQTTS